MAIADYAAADRHAQEHQGHEMIFNLANLVAGQEMKWSIPIPTEHDLLMNNLIVREMAPLFERAANGLKNPRSTFYGYGKFFSDYVSEGCGPCLVRIMDPYLKDYIKRFQETKRVLPFEFAPVEKREQVATLLYGLAENMKEYRLTLPRWSPPRASGRI